MWKKGAVSEAVRDYYEVLGVARGADAPTIKQAFRAQARLLHPDVSRDADAEVKFRELADAYSALSKPASRLLYDRFGYRGQGAWAASPSAAQTFNGLFQFWTHSKPRARGTREVAEVELDFYEAARGGRRTVSYTSRSACPDCDGEAVTCSACSGSGYTRESRDDGDVRVLQLVTCEACYGSGQANAGHCVRCGDSGEVEERREVEISIPSGVEDGARIQLADADGPEAVVRVRSQPRDSAAMRVAAALGLVVAVAFLVFLLVE